jgi:ADP-ribose pyrophosphatase
MATKKKPAKAAEPKKSVDKREAAKSKPEKIAKPKKAKKKLARIPQAAVVETAQIISSKVVYTGPLFRILHDKLVEPGGRRSERDVIRHNGSVVILAIDSSKSRKDPWIVIERQYRHAANQFLWELPAGKLDPGEDALTGA